jgi:carboxylesterase type B
MWRLLPAILFFTVGNTSAKIIDTLYGKVDGNTVSLDDGTVVNSWWGIPFARPPTGELRFEVNVKIDSTRCLSVKC